MPCEKRVRAVERSITLSDAHRYGYKTKRQYAQAIVYGKHHETGVRPHGMRHNISMDKFRELSKKSKRKKTWLYR
jgi:hypothetical protein